MKEVLATGSEIHWGDSKAKQVGKKMADLERELNTAKVHLADANRGARINANINESLIKKNNALLEELNEARKDKGRLDWLEKELIREQWCIERAIDYPFSLFRRNEPITRQAIDAAMQEKGKE